MMVALLYQNLLWTRETCMPNAPETILISQDNLEDAGHQPLHAVDVKGAKAGGKSSEALQLIPMHGNSTSSALTLAE
jgi:hypothetical protein